MTADDKRNQKGIENYAAFWDKDSKNDTQAHTENRRACLSTPACTRAGVRFADVLLFQSTRTPTSSTAFVPVDAELCQALAPAS